MVCAGCRLWKATSAVWGWEPHSKRSKRSPLGDLKLFWTPRIPANWGVGAPTPHLSAFLWPRGRGDGASHVEMLGRVQGVTIL